MKWLIVGLVVVAAAFVPTVANAQACDGVTVTREDGGINCFPPAMPEIETFYGGAENVQIDESGNLWAGVVGGDDGSTTMHCSGCNAVTIRSNQRRNNVTAYEFEGSQITLEPTRTKQLNLHNGAAYVPSRRTTILIVVVDGAAELDPMFYHID